MENRCKFLVLPLRQKRPGKINPVSIGFLILLMLLVTSMTGTGNLINAQQGAVTGIVKDQSGQPIGGATVLVKGTTNGALTGTDGRFTLTNVAPDATITFSFIGFVTQDQAVGGRSTIDVTLAEMVSALEEIIVVGYSTQTKKTLTGAVSAVQANDLTRTITPTASGALVGKVAGITARLADARPGASTTLQIRNFGTPLFIIDGVPRTTADFNNIEVDNIESISILKDASAAIYGLLAANGVVLVTTKMGKISEKPKINVNAYYGLQGFTRFPQPANAYYYTLGLAESAQNRGIATSITQADLDNYKTGFYDPANGLDFRSFDYLDYIIGQNTPAPQKFLNASATGASERASYYISVGHLDQDAVIESFWYKRTSIQANVEAKLAKGLKVGSQISARYELRHQAGIPGIDDYPNIFNAIMRNWPTERPFANDNPKYVNNTHSININPATYQEWLTGPTNESDRVFRGNFYGEYDFGFGLKARATVAYGYSVYLWECFEYTYDAYTYDRLTDTYNVVPGGGNKNPFRETRRRHIEDRFGQFQLSYNKKIDKHSIAAVAAYEQSYNDNQYLALHTIPPNNYIPTQRLENQDALTNTWAMSARASYIGRVNYNYDERYLMEFLGRYDGSYLYAPDKRWGFFPGISLGWRISNEGFFTPLKGIVSELKLRGSWGQTGSESGVSAFGYQEGFNWASGNYIFNGTTITGIIPRGIPVTNLSWVTNISKNIGFDISLFNGKVNGQFDLFERRVTGIPAARYDVLLPSEVGYSLPDENLNTTANRGIEGMVDYSGEVAGINFTIGANATLSRQRTIEVYKPRFGNSWDEYRNSSLDRWNSINWGYHILGQFQSQEEIDDYPVNIDGQANRTLLPGDLIYEDLNGDMIINTMDQKPIGYATGATPYLSFGINTTFEYKGITLVADFAGGTMQTFIRNNELKIPFAGSNNGNSPDWLLMDRWHRADPFDPNSEWIPGTNPPTRKDVTSHSNFNKTNDFYLLNVSYMRLRSLEIGYNIPEKLLQKVGASKLRVYTNLSNLFSIDNVGKKYHIDPEITSTGGLVYPQSRVYNFGFILTL